VEDDEGPEEVEDDEKRPRSPKKLHESVS